MWRVIPGKPAPRGKAFWHVGQEDAEGTLHLAVTKYNQAPRKWFSEQAARDYCAGMLRFVRAGAQAVRRAEEAKRLATCWPFPVSTRYPKEKPCSLPPS